MPAILRRALSPAAAPVRDMTGQVVAAINVTAPKSPESEAELRAAIRDDLLSTAGRISRLLGWDSPAEG